MRLTIGISPCPNDTFIFDAMLNGKIDTEGITFDYQLEDVETLNTMAMSGALDISKISYGAVHHFLQHYIILNTGGALGNGVGPLFISKKFTTQTIPPVDSIIALPGINTTAHLLFSMIYPQHSNKVFMAFDQIQEAVLSGNVDAGVIIHENRFTYQEKGLNKITDLGDAWERNTGLPIPLGGIIARRSFDKTTLIKIDRIIGRSLDYALQQGQVLSSFVVDNAQEMSEDIMRSHIRLYVNKYSSALGELGKSAVIKIIEASYADTERRAALNELFVDENLE